MQCGRSYQDLTAKRTAPWGYVTSSGERNIIGSETFFEGGGVHQVEPDAEDIAAG
jgi:hypothetical protein